MVILTYVIRPFSGKKFLLVTQPFIWVIVSLTVNDHGARFLHHEAAGLHLLNGFLVLEPSNGWLRIPGGLAR